jgi:hypothetical protein
MTGESQNAGRANDKAKRRRQAHTVRAKCMAVLSVWAQKRRAVQVCREMGVSWGILNQWEKRALQGMLRGLGQMEEAGEQPVNLGRRLERLLTGSERAPECKPGTEAMTQA